VGVMWGVGCAVGVRKQSIHIDTIVVPRAHERSGYPQMELVIQPGEDPSAGISRNSINIRDNFARLLTSVLKGSEIGRPRVGEVLRKMKPAALRVCCELELIKRSGLEVEVVCNCGRLEVEC
jgi:hypothetical protein